MLFDAERVLLELEEYIDTRTSHGRDALHAQIRRLRRSHRIEEGLVEKATRLYGPELAGLLRDGRERTPDDAPSGTESLSEPIPLPVANGDGGHNR
jgi:hypothetical protein